MVKSQQNWAFSMIRFQVERGIGVSYEGTLSLPKPLERGPAGRASRSGLRVLFRAPMGNRLITL